MAHHSHQHNLGLYTWIISTIYISSVKILETVRQMNILFYLSFILNGLLRHCIPRKDASSFSVRGDPVFKYQILH